MQEFSRKASAQLATDGGNNLTYLAPTLVNLKMAEERYPEITFAKTREQTLVMG